MNVTIIDDYLSMENTKGVIYHVTCTKSLRFLRGFGNLVCSGYPIHSTDEGTRSVSRISIIFCSSNIPIQIELKPKAWAAS
jgi:hypothetical protein